MASVTADNGSEFTLHHRLADTIGGPTYCADPYSAWQRGTNEHFNGRIRKYLPKQTSFADFEQAELNEIINRDQRPTPQDSRLCHPRGNHRQDARAD